MKPAVTRVAALDVLRGIAILLVLFHHPALPAWTGGAFAPLVVSLFRVGWTGVDLFFVLSGFLVGGLLLREQRAGGTIGVRRFLLRRTLKIWPSYFALLALVFVRLAWSGAGKDTATAFRRLIPNLFHVQNYYHWTTPRIPTWSLAVEEHFYIALPLALVTLAWVERRGRFRRPLLSPLVLVVALVCLGLRCVAAARGLPSNVILLRTHFRIDSLLFGVWLAHVSMRYPDLLARWMTRSRAWITAGVLCVTPMLVFPVERSAFVATIGFTLLYLGYGAILMAQVHGAQPRDGLGWTRRILAAIGRTSYTMYLWFLDTADGLRFLGFTPDPPSWLAATGMGPALAQGCWWLAVQTVFIAVVFGVGHLTSALIERPILAWRDRRFPSSPLAPTS